MGCIREVKYKVTLSGPNSTEPKQGQPYLATVHHADGMPITESVTVNVSLKVSPTSGGHAHGDSTRPKGSIAGTECQSDETCRALTTDANGVVGFDFLAPEAAGTHTITVTCDKCSNSVSKNVDVKVEGLTEIPSSIFFEKISPNADTNHPNAGFLSSEAIARLRDIGLQYSAMGLIEFGAIVPPLQINDASLKWGGVLDCFLTCSNSKEWGPSHEEHRKGTVVDIRANGGTGSIPNSKKMTSKFSLLVNRLILAKYPASNKYIKIAGLHGKGNFRHFHVRLLGRKE
jgi:hypothetical protein